MSSISSVCSTPLRDFRLTLQFFELFDLNPDGERKKELPFWSELLNFLFSFRIHLL